MEKKIVTVEKKWEKDRTKQFKLLKIVGIFGLFLVVVEGIGAAVFLLAVPDPDNEASEDSSNSDADSDSETISTSEPTNSPITLSPTFSPVTSQPTTQPINLPTETPTSEPTQNPTAFTPFTTTDPAVFREICEGSQFDAVNFFSEFNFAVCIDNFRFILCRVQDLGSLPFTEVQDCSALNGNAVCGCTPGDIIDVRFGNVVEFSTPHEICADISIPEEIVPGECRLIDGTLADVDLRDFLD